jgi:DNA-binding transcriptional LysR family regulator
MDDDLVSEVLSEEPMLFLTAPDSLPALKGRFTIHNLAETCVILTEPGCSYRLMLEKIIGDCGVTPQSYLEAGSTEAIKQLIMLGMGISMLPRFAVEKKLTKGRICAVPWKGSDFHGQVQMLYHKDKWISPTLQAFLDTTRQFYNKKNGTDLTKVMTAVEST